MRKRINLSVRRRLRLRACRLANFSAYLRACLLAPTTYTLFERQKFRQHLCREAAYREVSAVDLCTCLALARHSTPS